MAINPKISTSGRIMMVDPNPDGNGSVNLENLSIIVELDTESKGRSVVNIETNTVSSTTTKSGKTPVKFIDGTKAGKNKNLTTNYTETNTTFNKKGNDLESLGIVDIDIAFNSALAPIVKINFVDVRGNSVFERGNESDYRVFFDLPYPIFKLTVKGYYGKAVTYCLHLTKWNSLFNSDTGNYEISCEFVGYTYAILTDLLIGYLKGIGETSYGKSLLGKYKLPDGSGVADESGNIRIPTILELMQIISKVNKEVNTIKKSNNNVKQLKLANDTAKVIEKIKGIVDTFINTINQNGEGQKILDGKTKGITVVPISDNVLLNKRLVAHKKNISALIKTSNELISDGYKLEVNDFITIPLYTEISVGDIRSYNPNPTTTPPKSTVDDMAATDDRLLSLLNNLLGSKFNDTTPLNIIDVRKSYEAVQAATNKLEEIIITQKEKVSEIIKGEIPKIIGFKPTIANMLAIFTAHGEVFLDVIKGIAVETTKDKKRTSKLTSFETSDISKQTSTDSTGNPSGDMVGEVFPFPEFTNKEGTEVWVGDKVTIPETEFIEELLRGMLDYSKSEEKILNLLSQDSQSWFPINPLDTEIGGVLENPYLNEKIFNTNDINVALRLVGQRAAIFLGYSLSDYTIAEMQIMAAHEANNLYSSLSNDVTKDNFSSSFVKSDELLTRLNNLNILDKLSDNVDNIKGSMFTPSPVNTGYLSYNYIHKIDKIAGPKDRPKSYINIGEPFDGNNFLDKGLVKKQTKIKGSEGIYISNYANDAPVADKLNSVDDGATYVKLIPIESFNNNTDAEPTVPDEIKKLHSGYYDGLEDMTEDFLEKESLPKTAGRKDRYNNYNQFGGSWYTQEFVGLKDMTIYGGSNSDNLFGGDDSVNDVIISFYEDTTSPTDYGLSDVRPIHYKTTEGFEEYKLSQIVRTFSNGVPTDTVTNGLTFINIGDETTTRPVIPESLKSEITSLSRRYFNQTSLGYTRRGIANLIAGKKDVVFPVISYDTFKSTDDDDKISTSLFSSNLYFEQDTEEARALLFLHALPFKGLAKTLAIGDSGLFSAFDIKNLFKRRAGFVRTPKAWILLIGALLWRNQEAIDPIKFIRNGKSLIAGADVTITTPTKNQYLKADISDPFTSLDAGSKSLSFTPDKGYTPIEDVFLNLPSQVKTLFITEFKEWVVSSSNTGWITIKDGLELFNFGGFTDKTKARTAWTSLYNDFTTTPLTNSNALKNHTSAGVNTIKNVDNFNIINKLTTYPRVADNTTMHNNFFVEHKEGTESMKSLLSFMIEPIMVLNSTWRIWDDNNADSDDGNQLFKPTGTNIEVNEADLKTYLTAFHTEFERLSLLDKEARATQNDNIKSDLFNSIDNDKIKLNLYRNVKAVYDKWVAGTTDVLAHCGGGNIKEKEDPNINNTGGKLINSFHFLSKSFIDIGDKFFINPLGIINNISGNFNQSLYDIVGRTLSDNNFNFNPLPSFIDFKDPKELVEMFTPFPYSKSIRASTVGPSFVCTYIGDRSKHLDLGSDASYSNDGFDFKTDGTGGITGPAKAYTTGDNSEMSIPVFAVNYGDQNQSIFKNIKLNQQEYSETDESLQIMDDISKGGSPNSKTYMGQNMFNVYSTRSYSAEIEMLGNATIQPMMYFQLNSIPMFHGAFLITSVRHKLKPNHMTTTVTGVRVRKQDVPLIDEKTVYMNFIDIIDGVKTDGVSLTPLGPKPDWNYNENITKIIKS